MKIQKTAILIITVCLSGLVFAIPDGPWSANIVDPVDRLKLILAINRSHQKVVEMNFDYPVNSFSIFDPIPGLLNQLKDNGQSLAIDPTPIHSLQVRSNLNIEYDQNKISDVKETIDKALAEFQNVPLTGIENDLEALRASARTNPDPRARLVELSAQYFVALPLLYSDQMEPLSVEDRQKQREKIRQSTISELESKYFDLYQEHQVPVFKSKLESYRNSVWAKGVLAKHEKQFLNRQMRGAIQPIVKAGEPYQERIVSIQKVPPAISPLRGVEGEDCSSITAPYFGLIKNVDVYWIRKSRTENRPVEGYMVVAQVTHEGKTVPSIITINGPRLSRIDVGGLVGLVASIYNAESVGVPNFQVGGSVRNLVNSHEIREGLTFENSKSAVVEMPAGWDTIQDYQARNTPFRFENYYQTRNTSQIRIVPAPQTKKGISKLETTSPVELYKEVTDLTIVSVFERTKLALDSLQKNSSADLEKNILLALNLTTKHLEAAKLAWSKTRSLINFRDLIYFHNTIDMQLQDIALFNPLKAALSLNEIYKEAPNIADEKEWAKLFSKINKDLVKAMEEALDSFSNERNLAEKKLYGEMFLKLKAAKFEIPLAFQTQLESDTKRIMIAAEKTLSLRGATHTLGTIVEALKNEAKQIDSIVVDWFLRFKPESINQNQRFYWETFDLALARVAFSAQGSLELQNLLREARLSRLERASEDLRYIDVGFAVRFILSSSNPEKDFRDLRAQFSGGVQMHHKLLYEKLSSLDLSPRLAQATLDDYRLRKAEKQVFLDSKYVSRLTRRVKKTIENSCAKFYSMD